MLYLVVMELGAKPVLSPTYDRFLKPHNCCDIVNKTQKEKRHDWSIDCKEQSHFFL